MPLATGSLQWQSPLLHFQCPDLGPYNPMSQLSQRTAVPVLVPGETGSGVVGFGVVGFGVTFPGATGPDVTGPG